MKRIFFSHFLNLKMIINQYQNQENYIIKPPIEFQDKPVPKPRTKTTKKPVSYPRTKINFHAKTLKSVLNQLMLISKIKLIH